MKLTRATQILLLSACTCWMHIASLGAQVVTTQPPKAPIKPPIKAPAKVPVKAPATPAAKPAATSRSLAPAPPNIVLLVVNDWGWQDLSVPLFRDTTDANRTFLTPAVARLAAEGVTFTNAYASSPVGSPTRATLLTGRPPAFTRVTNDVVFAQPAMTSTPTSNGTRDPFWNSSGVSGTPAERAYTGVLLPKLLHAAGYRTVHVGRTEWSASDARFGDARAVGFDESVPAPVRAADWPTATLNALATVSTTAPFFLHVDLDAIALTSTVDSAVLNLEALRGLELATAQYAARIATVDSTLSALCAWLASHGAVEHTIVIVTSDNGGVATAERSGLRFMQNAPLSSGMGSAYEGGLRVPLFVRWPGVARAGRRIDTPVITDDLFPTLLYAARASTIVASMRDAVGHDLASTLDQSVPLASDRPLIWHYPHVGQQRGPGMEPFSAIRAGKWKLIFFYSGSRYELYDVSADIGEQRNQLLRQPEIAARLAEQLRSALSATNAQMPLDAAYGTPLGLPGRIIVPTPPD